MSPIIKLPHLYHPTAVKVLFLCLLSVVLSAALVGASSASVSHHRGKPPCGEFATKIWAAAREHNLKVLLANNLRCSSHAEWSNNYSAGRSNSRTMNCTIRSKRKRHLSTISNSPPEWLSMSAFQSLHATTSQTCRPLSRPFHIPKYLFHYPHRLLGK